MSENFADDLVASRQTPLKENFDYHVITVKLLRGEASGITFEVECKGGDKDDCVCDPSFCQLKELIALEGVDVIRSAGDIDLMRLSTRVDWSDPDEPWVDVEP